MKIFPAIDLFQKKAVRLLKGDYNQMTVYSDNPPEIALDFKNSGAEYLHVVDLEGAKNGTASNYKVIEKLVKVGLKTQVGGGIRNTDMIKKYVDLGVERVILGTIAVTDDMFLKNAVKEYGEKIAVGVDIKDGFVAIKGWTETSKLTAEDFCKHLEDVGVKTIICTDISRDGAMQGSNTKLYEFLKSRIKLNIIASGGVSTIEDVKTLKQSGIYGAIIGKAYYTKAISLEEAIEVAK